MNLALVMCYSGVLVSSVQFSLVIQSCLTLCDLMDWSTPGFPAITNSQSLLKLTSIESVMPSNHLILCCPLLLPPSIFPSIRVFLNESVLCLVMCYTKSLQSWLLFATLWTIACQGPLSMGFSRQENWGVYHALLQGIFLTQGLDLRFFHLLHRQVGSLPLALPGKLYSHTFYHLEKWWVYSRKSHKEIRSDQSLSRVLLFATGKQDTVTINCQEETHDFLKCKLLIKSHLISPIG